MPLRILARLSSRATLVMVLAVSCARENPGLPAATGLNVVILGLDAATWDIITPLADQGRLPNFHRLMSEGATGVLRTHEPTWSPVVWTSIATGVIREHHGITDFVSETADGRRVPFTSNQRRRRALWTILSDAGRTVGVVNWWVSYPAEQVNGFIVSNYWRYFYHRMLAHGESDQDLLPSLADAVYPRSLVPRITDAATTAVPPWDILDRHILEQYEVEGAVDPSFGMDFGRDEAIFRHIIERDEIVRVIAEKLYREERPEFFAVYFEGIDAACHLYWPYAHPDEYSVAATEARDLGGVIDSCYVIADRVLGTYMDLIDSTTVLVVCSDHGYGSLGGGKHFHVPDGMIAWWGNPIRAGASIPVMRDEDVAPSVLAIMGFPRARDMDGTTVDGMLVDRYRRSLPTSEVKTYERGKWVRTEPLVSPVDEEVLVQLEALGYLERPKALRSSTSADQHTAPRRPLRRSQ